MSILMSRPQCQKPASQPVLLKFPGSQFKWPTVPRLRVNYGKEVQFDACSHLPTLDGCTIPRHLRHVVQCDRKQHRALVHNINPHYEERRYFESDFLLAENWEKMRGKNNDIEVITHLRESAQHWNRTYPRTLSATSNCWVCDINMKRCKRCPRRTQEVLPRRFPADHEAHMMHELSTIFAYSQNFPCLCLRTRKDPRPHTLCVNVPIPLSKGMPNGLLLQYAHAFKRWNKYEEEYKAWRTRSDEVQAPFTLPDWSESSTESSINEDQCDTERHQRYKMRKWKLRYRRHRRREYENKT